MKKPNVYISFDCYNDTVEKGLFVGQTSLSTKPFKVFAWSKKHDLSHKDWAKSTGELLEQCNILLVLVGRNTFQTKDVLKEIVLARNRHVPYFGVYIDNVDLLTPLPEGLDKYRMLDWRWKRIGAAINQLMSEGKNKLSEPESI